MAGAGQAVAAPVTIELTHFGYFGDVSDWPDLKTQYAQEFEKKFGVALKVDLIPRNSYLEKLYLMVASGEIHGLVRTFSPADILKFIQDGSIEPLDAYLKDNAVYQQKFASTGNVFTYEGQTWAINAGYTGNVFARYWRKDWLDKLGLNTPQTIDELYNAAKLMTEKDPDGNGKKDTVGITGASVAWNLQDIFHAYDAKINNTGGGSVAWDPVTQAWDDSMLKPGMVNALFMLNRLYTNGYLDNEFATNTGSQMRTKLWSGQYGGTFYWLHWGIMNWLQGGLSKAVPTAQVSTQIAATGTRKQYLNQYVAGGVQYVLLKGTPNAKDVVNKFMDIFYGSAEGNIWGRYGLPGVTYRMDGNRIVQLKDKAGNLMPTPGFIERTPEYDVDKYPVVPDGPLADQQDAINMWNQVRLRIDAGLQSKLLFDASGIRDAPFSDTYTTLQKDYERLFNDAVIKAATGQLTPSAAIQAYRDAVKKMGGQKAIDEANAFLSKAWGKTIKAKYTY
jgi:hypothetical protein